MRLLGSDSVTTPSADAPPGITQSPSRTTSSATTKSTTSPTCAVSEETVLLSFKWMGVLLGNVRSKPAGNGICRRRRRGFVISGPRSRGLRRGAKRRLSAGPVFEQDKAPFPYVSGLPVGGTHAEETLVAPGDLNLLAALQSP